MTEQAGALAPGGPPRRRSLRHRVHRVRVAHRPEAEQARDRRQPPVDRGRREPRRAAASQRDHVLVLPVPAFGAVRGQVAQQDIGTGLIQAGPVSSEPAGKVQQVERVSRTVRGE
jgi:hypothetical protein